MRRGGGGAARHHDTLHTGIDNRASNLNVKALLTCLPATSTSVQPWPLRAVRRAGPRDQEAEAVSRMRTPALGPASPPPQLSAWPPITKMNLPAATAQLRPPRLAGGWAGRSDQAGARGRSTCTWVRGSHGALRRPPNTYMVSPRLAAAACEALASRGGAAAQPWLLAAAGRE